MKHKVLSKKKCAEMAEEIGNLRYDSLSIFLNELSNKLAKDAREDYRKGRIRLSQELTEAFRKISDSVSNIYLAWKICESHEDNK